MQKFDPFQSIDPDIVAAEHRLDVVQLDFVGRWAIKYKAGDNENKIPLAFAFSSSRNKPALDADSRLQKYSLLIFTCDLYSWFNFTQ